MKKWPIHKAYFWEAAPFSRLLIPLVAGIISYSCLPLPFNAVVIGIVVCLAAYLVTAFVRKTTTLSRSLHFVLLHVIIFFGAWALCHLNDDRRNPAWFGKRQDADAFMAVIKHPPAEKEKTWKLNVAVKAALKDNKAYPTCGKAFVYTYKDLQQDFTLKEGDTIVLPNKWQPIKNAGNPFEFDYAAYCAHSNIYYQQFLPQYEVVVLGAGHTNSLSWIQRTHNWCMVQLQRYISDTTTLGLMQAMLVGDEANLDNDTRQAYSETGIIHVIAISGSHIAFFFVIISLLLSWIKNRKQQWIKYAIAVPLIWAYVLISGAPPSAVRAAIMFTILGVGFSLGKQHNSLNQLFATAFLLLCAEPMWLYSVGFQLSFVAVLSILIFYKPLYNFYHPTSSPVRMLWATVCVSISAELLTAPLVVYYFHIFPLMFIVANIAAFLLMSIVMIFGMLIILLSSIPVVASAIGVLTTWLVEYFNKLVVVLQQLNPSSFRYLNLQGFELALLYAVVVLLSIYMLVKKKGTLFGGLAVSSVLLFSLCYDQWRALHQQKLIVYNINHINHIELIRGRYYSVLRTDTIVADKKKNYTLKPAHVALSSWRERRATARDVLQIGKKSVLLLDRPIFQHFHFDYVIVNYKLRVQDIGMILQAYSPQKIVLGSNISRKQVDAFLEAGQKLSVPIYSTQAEGAFMLSAL